MASVQGHFGMKIESIWITVRLVAAFTYLSAKQSVYTKNSAFSVILSQEVLQKALIIPSAAFDVTCLHLQTVQLLWANLNQWNKKDFTILGQRLFD